VITYRICILIFLSEFECLVQKKIEEEWNGATMAQSTYDGPSLQIHEKINACEL